MEEILLTSDLIETFVGRGVLQEFVLTLQHGFFAWLYIATISLYGHLLQNRSIQLRFCYIN